MNCEIQNLTRGLVSIHCNSGATYHLPPGYKHELPEQEIIRNPSIKKLVDRKLITVRDVVKTNQPKIAAKSTEPAPEVKESPQETGKTTRKKSDSTK